MDVVAAAKLRLGGMWHSYGQGYYTGVLSSRNRSITHLYGISRYFIPWHGISSFS